MNKNNENNSNLLNNFTNYCKNKIDDNEFMTTFSEMLIYDDYLIYKDILNEVLKLRKDSLDRLAKKTDKYEVVRCKQDELPEKAFYLDKDKIQKNTNIWFVDRKNFLKIIILFRSDKNLKIINYLLELENLLIKFLKEYGNTYMVEKQYITDELMANIIKIKIIEKELNESKKRIFAMNMKKIDNIHKKTYIKEDFICCVNNLVPESCESSLLQSDNDSDNSRNSITSDTEGNNNNNYKYECKMGYDIDENADRKKHLRNKYSEATLNKIRIKKSAKKMLDEMFSIQS